MKDKIKKVKLKKAPKTKETKKAQKIILTLTDKEAKELDYPYYSYYYHLDKNKILNIIQHFKPEILTQTPLDYYGPVDLKFFKYDDKKINEYFLIKENWKKYEEINNLTDYFSDKVRVKCVFGNYLSPLEFWKKNKNFIIKLKKKKYNDLTIPNIREIIYFNNKLCNNFRVTVVISVLNSFKHDRYLDISAGWGDRLLGAIFSNVKRYISADPNIELHPCYNKIKDTFLSEKDRDNFIIYPMSFLDIPLENEEPFDIVFSSPPFFTLEKYSMFDQNSITDFMDEKKWINNFFVKCLIKCYNHLKKDGIMILYMGGSKQVFDNMFRLNKIMDYLGLIYYFDQEEKKPGELLPQYKSMRKMFVWKKTKDDVISDLPPI